MKKSFMKSSLVSMIVAPFIALLSACTPLGALNAFSARGNDSVNADIAYGPLQRQKLDIYVPTPVAANAPVIVFFYGGRWKMGQKSDYRFVAHALTSQGFIVVVPDLRFYPAVRFPTFVQDAAQAVVWTHQHIARYGGDIAHIFTMGHSSGAYNAVMLAMNPAYLRQAGGEIADIKGAIGLAGPYDFLPFTEDDIKDIFSTAPDQRITQPITYAASQTKAGKHPPVLLLHGEEDTSVKPENTRHLAAALRQAGSEAESILYPGIGHIDILLSLSSTFRDKAPALRDSADFIRRHAETP